MTLHSSRLLGYSLIIAFSLFMACTNSESTNPPKTGVLVLAHGSADPTWNNTVTDVTASLAEQYPLEIAFGMANPYSMQPAIDSLEAENVDQIVVVPLFVSSFSPIIRQNEFLLGLRDSLADAPMPPMAHEMTDEMKSMMAEDMSHKKMTMDHSGHDMHDSEFTLEPLDINSKIIFTEPLDDHPLIGEILYERVEAVSKNPSTETILLVAHGPVKDSDNEKWVSTLENLGEQIRRHQAEHGKEDFYKIISLTVRDDASEEVYDAAKQEFRSFVKEAGEYGEAIVIPVLLSKGGVERRYLTRLEGLDYVWGGETILPHKNVATFLEQSVSKALQENK